MKKMSAACVCLYSLIIFVAGICADSWADWNTDQQAKWVQLPDESMDGMDVKLYDTENMPPLVLADDFECTQTGPISDVHLWGSWRFDEVGDPSFISFHLSIWSDVPTNQVNPYSHPGEMLWETNVFYPDFTMRQWTNVAPGEWWYDPGEDIWEPVSDTLIWQFNFLFDSTNSFVQEGTPEKPLVYWLAVRAFINDPKGGMWALGWKCSSQHWNDDAVYSFEPLQGWNELRYPIGHPLAEKSMDLAFVITTTNQVEVEAWDFGDAPAVYPVQLAANGARHLIVTGAPWFGESPGGPDPDLPDAETDGQPHPQALGDDFAGLSPDDEDGVIFASPLITGQAGLIMLKLPLAGQVDAWIDFNGDGAWSAGEQIFSGVLTSGVHMITATPPFGSVVGSSFARFRVGSAALGSIPVIGPWSDGEVEDHAVQIEEAIDFGDAPDPSFPTLMASTGAAHAIVSGVHLGSYVDGELDGQPNGTSTGDDLAPGWLPDDEDGILLPPRLIIGAVQNMSAMASTFGTLFMWVDYNGDGDWNDAAETLPPQFLSPGTNTFQIVTPGFATPGGVHSRFRFTATVPMLGYSGFCPDGEVEDYEIVITYADFGDAPDGPYPTLLTSTGAWHAFPSTVASPAVFLGATIDSDQDGLPTFDCQGDDQMAMDDEDGVSVVTSLIRGGTGVVSVVSSTNAMLFVWIDFDQNGSWDDTPDAVIAGLVVTSGINSVNLPVPQAARIGSTYARFRVTTSGVLSPRGFAPDGEVEDYLIGILQPGPANDIVITNLAVIGGTGTVYWTSETNTTYQLQSTSNLLVPVSPTWLDIGGLVDDPVHMQHDPDMTRSVKFYRVTAPWTP